MTRRFLVLFFRVKSLLYLLSWYATIYELLFVKFKMSFRKIFRLDKGMFINSRFQNFYISLSDFWVRIQKDIF